MVYRNGCCRMKKRLTYYVFTSVALGTLVYVSDRLGLLLPTYVRFYLNDFLILPIVLYAVLVMIRKLKRDVSLQLSVIHIVYSCTMYALFFEYWLPTFHPRYTSDLIDVLLYFLSGFVFYCLQKDAGKFGL